MIGAGARWGAIPLLAGLLLLGCRVVPRRPVASDPPGPHEVRQAGSRLSDTVLREVAVSGWPEHVGRSQDFPDLPLVRVRTVEDRGAWGVDLKILRRTLEQTLRGQKALRLLADEQAVPPSLREPSEVEWRPAGKPLEVEGWTGTDGAFHVLLLDPVSEKVLARARSDVAGRH